MSSHCVLWEHQHERAYPNVYVIECHPKYEEIFVTGSYCGEIKIWDISTKSVLNTFVEPGTHPEEVYYHPQVFDGKFSPDGTNLVICSNRGSFSIYSCWSTESYYATPLEQFQVKRIENENELSFEERKRNQIISNVDGMVQEIQPPQARLGEFRQFTLTSREYSMNLNERQ